MTGPILSFASNYVSAYVPLIAPQVVWAKSTHLGCAAHYCENGIDNWFDRNGNPYPGYIVFCNYGPG